MIDIFGRRADNRVCLILFVCHWAVAGEIIDNDKNKEKSHSGRILLQAGTMLSMEKDSSGMTSTAASLALQTNHLHLVPKGRAWFHTGLELRTNWQAPITQARGDLYRYGTLRLDFGIAENVSIQIRGAIKQILRTNSQIIAKDAGDFSIATIARILTEGPNRPALGFRIETKLPNTNQDRGIGNNTTDITLAILATKQFGPALVFSDLGLAILSAPRQINDQNDALVYGLGALWNVNKKIQLAGEINGFTSPRNQIPLGTEDRSAARLGFVWKFQKLAVEILAVKGLVQREGDWGVAAGLSAQINFFRN